MSGIHINRFPAHSPFLPLPIQGGADHAAALAGFF